LVQRDDLARDREQAHGREHRGQSEDERDARCDECAEREQEDAERDRQRELAGLLERAHEGVVDLLLGGYSKALDVVVGMARLSSLDRRRNGPDLVGRIVRISGDLCVDERGVPVQGHEVHAFFVEGRRDLAHVRLSVEAVHDVGDHGLELGRARVERRGLDHHALDRRSLELVGQNLVHPAGFTDACLGRVELLRADDHRPDDECQQHEGEPAPDSGFSVSRAPVAHAGREISRLVHFPLAPSS
jgi:hypothetical protein